MPQREPQIGKQYNLIIRIKDDDLIRRALFLGERREGSLVHSERAIYDFIYRKTKTCLVKASIPKTNSFCDGENVSELEARGDGFYFLFCYQSQPSPTQGVSRECFMEWNNKLSRAKL